MIKTIGFDIEGIILKKGGMNLLHTYILGLGVSEKDMVEALYFSNEAKDIRLGKINESYYWGYVNKLW